MSAVLVALLTVTGVVLLFTGSGSSEGGGGLESRDGVLSRVEPTQIVLEPSDGGSAVTYALRPIDARRIDLPHLQAHREQGLASRVFFEREGGALYAVRVDDLQTPP